MVKAYIGLGSNLDDPIKQVRTALEELNSIEKTRLVKASRLYRTKPMGPQDQPDYINAVAEIDTDLDADILLSALQQLENNHGRIRQRHWGERTLDLDILMYADQQICTEHLTVPHPGMVEREFVLYPLFEIAKELQIPGKGKLKALIQQCPANGIEHVE